MKLSCVTCFQGMSVIEPSVAKVGVKSPSFLEHIQGDICRPIRPICGSFKYLMIYIDSSTIWSNVCLFSTRNMDFVRLLPQLIWLKP